MNKVIVAYVPVLHRGYWEFFRKYAAAVDTVCVFGQELIEQFKPLTKDIRALPPQQIIMAIESWRMFPYVRVVDEHLFNAIKAMKLTVIMPDEDESRAVAEKYLKNCPVEFDNSIFLRWDKTKSLAVNDVSYDRAVPISSLEGGLMNVAVKASEKGTNFWRRIGALIARDGQLLLAGYNRQVPSPHVPYFEGDARSFFSRGVNIELTTDQHAEAHLISEAARRGIVLEGADLYITTFPCPVCAKLVAYAGIKRCYFSSGYAMLDGERILRDKSIEIILVKMEE